MDVTMPVSELWTNRVISFVCGMITSVGMLATLAAVEGGLSAKDRVDAKCYMLDAMNYANDMERWRLKQMAEAVKTSPIQTIEEIRMYEEAGAFPAERPTSLRAESPVGVPTR